MEEAHKTDIQTHWPGLAIEKLARKAAYTHRVPVEARTKVYQARHKI